MRCRFGHLGFGNPDPELQTRVLSPFLGGPAEERLQRRKIRLALDASGMVFVGDILSEFPAAILLNGS